MLAPTPTLVHMLSTWRAPVTKRRAFIPNHWNSWTHGTFRSHSCVSVFGKTLRERRAPPLLSESVLHCVRFHEVCGRSVDRVDARCGPRRGTKEHGSACRLARSRNLLRPRLRRRFFDRRG